MNRICAALLGLLLASAAQAQSVSWPPPAGALAFLCVYNSSPPTLTTTNVAFAQCDSTGSLRVAASFTPSGTQDVNVKQINGVTPLMGNGITGTGSQRVTIASDNTAFSVNAIQSGTWTVTGAGGTFPVTQSTSPWVVSNGGTFPVQATLSAETTKVIGTVNQGTSPWVTSNSGTFAVQASQSGTWTVQPGNTANTTPWLVNGNVSNASSAIATGAISVPTIAYNYGYNGTTWDQLLVDNNKNLLVSPGGAPNLATAQVSVTTGNISVAAARTGRRAVTVTNVTGTSAIYCGNTGVATTTGTYLGATAGSSITLNTTVAIFCTVAATTQTVTVAETY